jgi:hypothetical protein
MPSTSVVNNTTLHEPLITSLGDHYKLSVAVGFEVKWNEIFLIKIKPYKKDNEKQLVTL